MRSEYIRAEMQRLVRQVPFQPFVITLENRQRLTVDHPENLIFASRQDGQGGSDDFYVRDGSRILYSNFEAVTTIAFEEAG